MQCVIAGCVHAFSDLKFTLLSQFLPALLSCEITLTECILLSLPTRLGGLGILDPTNSASRFYQASVCATIILSTAISKGFTLD